MQQTVFPRRFLPQEFTADSLEAIEAVYNDLLSRNIDDHIRCAIQPFCRLDIQRCQRIDPCSIDGTAVNPEHKLLNFPSSNLVDTMEIVNVCVIYLAWTPPPPLAWSASESRVPRSPNPG